MITVISGTNRPGSMTRVAAEHYYNVIKGKTEEEVHFIGLDDIQDVLLHAGMYSPDNMDSKLVELQDKAIIPANKFVVVSPEYNGSIPGVLKLFIDAISIREYKANFVGKKALLVGVASGRAGNLRGNDHMTGVFNHVGVTVFPNKLPLSGFPKLLGEDGKIADEGTLSVIDSHIDSFLKY